MKRYLVISAMLLLGALFGTNVKAQTPAPSCNPYTAAVRITGPETVTDATKNIITVGYWCAPTAPYLDYKSYCEPADMALIQGNAQVGAKFVAALKAGDYTAFPKVTRTAAMNEACELTQPKLKSVRPPATALTAKNGVTLTRPAFTIGADGKRVTQAFTVRAPVGARAACDRLMIVEDTKVYCSWESEEMTPVPLVTLVTAVK